MNSRNFEISYSRTDWRTSRHRDLPMVPLPPSNASLSQTFPEIQSSFRTIRQERKYIIPLPLVPPTRVAGWEDAASHRPSLSLQATTRDANTWKGETAGKETFLSLSSLYLEHGLYLSPFSLSLSLPFPSFGNQQVERETGGLAMYAWCRVRYDNPELWPVSVMTTSWSDVAVQ